MKTPHSLLPQGPILTRRLSEALRGNSAFPAPLTVLSRKLPPMMSTFPNEAVTCRFADGRKRRLFVKYEAGVSHNSHGHRGGISYERQVYEHILRDYPRFRPRYLGAHTDAHTGESWLILEYLDRCVRVMDIAVDEPSREPVAMLESARWIGRFHQAQATLAANGACSFLKKYNAEYYRGWSRRTARLTRPLHELHPWLPVLCKRDDVWMPILLNAPCTVIHGEYYGKTVMFKKNNVFPVDWESAAVGAGEIDLAALTEGIRWPGKVVTACVREYQRERWPEGSPASFPPTLDAARLYLHFRWLGERKDWTFHPKAVWRYEQLRSVGERLGLI